MKRVLIYCWGSLSDRMATEALKEAGFEVITFSDKMNDYHADAEFAQKFIMMLHAQKADVVFSYDYFPLISMICEMNAIPYATWIYDCPQYTLLSKTVFNSCNRIFCFDELYAMRLQNMGVEKVYHFPLAADMNMIKTAAKKDGTCYDCDISFVGGLYNGEKNRLLHTKLSEYSEGFIEGLLSAQKQVCGYNMIAGVLPETIVEEIIDKCEITLSDAYLFDSVSMAADAVNMKLTAWDREEALACLAEHFEVTLYSNSKLPKRLKEFKRLICKGTVDYRTQMPKVFYNSKINRNITSRTIESGIPQRVFDILACGGFCLTNYQPEIAELFEDGKELVMYTDMDDLLMKAEYYLEHEEERKQIAKAGYEKVCAQYAVNERIKELIESVCML